MGQLFNYGDVTCHAVSNHRNSTGCSRTFRANNTKHKSVIFVMYHHTKGQQYGKLSPCTENPPNREPFLFSFIKVAKIIIQGIMPGLFQYALAFRYDDHQFPDFESRIPFAIL